MDTDDIPAVDLRGRCSLCLRILSSETRGALASTSICNNCNLLFFEEQRRHNNSVESVEHMLSQRFQDVQSTISDHANQSRQPTRDITETQSNSYNSVLRDGGIFPLDAYDSDSDASVDIDAYFNHHDEDGDDGGNDGVEVVENTVGSSVGRIQLHRSLATNGRNRPNDWLNEILSDEGVRNSDMWRLFGILEDHTSGYGDYADVGTHSSRIGAQPAAVWFVKSLDCVVVDETGLVCVICKDNMCVGSVVNRLPCGHVYHPSCIVPWLNTRNTCPLCRYEVPTDGKDRSHDESEVQVQGALAESAGGGGRWRFVVAPLVSVVGIVVVLWLGGGLFGGYRDDRTTRWWSLFVNE